MNNTKRETCDATRDLYPQEPGLVVLRCGRKPHKTGKHVVYGADGQPEAELWGATDDPA